MRLCEASNYDNHVLYMHAYDWWCYSNVTNEHKVKRWNTKFELEFVLIAKTTAKFCKV